jgi:hypothetical protein
MKPKRLLLNFIMPQAYPQMEDGNQPTIDELEEINIGTDDYPYPIFISKRLSKESKEE